MQTKTHPKSKSGYKMGGNKNIFYSIPLKLNKDDWPTFLWKTI